MLIAVLAYAGVYTLARKALPWIVRRYPARRNAAAFVVESFAAAGAANALSLLAAAWYPNVRPDAPALNALLGCTFALGMHYLASDVATAIHPIYLPFLLGSLVFLAVPRSMAHAVGFGMLLVGAAVAFLKHQDLRHGRRALPASE